MVIWLVFTKIRYVMISIEQEMCILRKRFSSHKEEERNLNKEWFCQQLIVLYERLMYNWFNSPKPIAQNFVPRKLFVVYVRFVRQWHYLFEWAIEKTMFILQFCLLKSESRHTLSVYFKPYQLKPEKSQQTCRVRVSEGQFHRATTIRISNVPINQRKMLFRINVR